MRNYTEVRPPPPPQQLLQAGHGPTPHPSCRSSLASLPGSRPPPRSAQGEPLCAAGCPALWLGDGYCDEACYKAACRWDAQDCSAEPGCADGCLPTYLGDGECDAECNTAACAFDAGAGAGAASDCDAGAGECYTDPNGTDYRGAVSTTKSGLECQFWSHQSPQQHTKTHLNFPDDGLGGHNHCRNPGREEKGPWCYTTSTSMRFELCTIPPPQASCGGASGAGRPEGVWEHYKALCPVDCAGLLGNGRCETRCNISSCAFDRGDCGVGLAMSAVLGGGFVKKEVATSNELTLMGVGIAVGVLVGLFILRAVLKKKQAQEIKLRGYTLEERAGMDGTSDDI